MSDELDGISKTLNSIDKKMDYLSKQLRSIGQDVPKEFDAFLYLNEKLSPKKRIPTAGGWAAPYQTIARVVELFLDLNRDQPTIVELGGGVSTLWFAYAAQHRGDGKIISIEHDSEYLTKTRFLLEHHELSKWVETVLAPLDNGIAESRGEVWYSLAGMTVESIDILFVDGPPGLSGKKARYPGYPFFSRQLRDGAIIVLDDVDRQDEQDISREWLALKHPHGRLDLKERMGRSTLFQYTRFTDVQL